MSSRPTVTADNKGALIEFSAYLLLTSSILTVLIKIFTKFIVIKTLQSDDWFAIASLAFAVGQYATVFPQVRGGLGQHIGSLTAGQIELYQKAGYAVEIQYVLSIALAKMVTLRFLYTLARDDDHRLWVNATTASNAIWALVAFLGVAFQCRPPRVWDSISGVCLNQSAFWAFISSIDILIDLIITSLPMMILHRTHINRAKKINAIVAFAGRLLVIPATIFRLVNIFSAYKSTDITFDYFNAALGTEIATTFSIVFACISFIKPFLDTVETGLLASRVRNPSMGIRSQSSMQYIKLQYARNLFKPQERTIQEERDSPLVSRAQQRSATPEAYELTNKSSANAWTGAAA